MKKVVLFSLAAMLLFSSCGTIFGGHISDCQARRASGQPTRIVRPAALIADIILCPIIGLVVDFVDGAMYRPCESNGPTTPHHYNN